MRRAQARTIYFFFAPIMTETHRPGRGIRIDPRGRGILDGNLLLEASCKGHTTTIGALVRLQLTSGSCKLIGFMVLWPSKSLFQLRLQVSTKEVLRPKCEPKKAKGGF